MGCSASAPASENPLVDVASLSSPSVTVCEVMVDLDKLNILEEREMLIPVVMEDMKKQRFRNIVMWIPVKPSTADAAATDSTTTTTTTTSTTSTTSDAAFQDEKFHAKASAAAWSRARPLKGCVLISHGLHEHALRYHGAASALAEEGFAVFAIDHIGHGKSWVSLHFH